MRRPTLAEYATAEGRFTNGNPSSGTPATVVSDEQLNAITDELVNAVEGAGLTLDPVNSAQLLAAMGPGGSQCRLDYVSATTCRLSPHGGNRLVWPDRTSVAIPDAGVDLAASSLTADDTFYYVYAGKSGGVITLTASTTAPVVQAGVQVSSANANLVLVGGVVRRSGSFEDWSVISWFNRRPRLLHILPVHVTYNNQASVVDSYPVGLLNVAGWSLPFVCWGDTPVMLGATLTGHGTGTSIHTDWMMRVDGVDVMDRAALKNASGSEFVSVHLRVGAEPSTGLHTATVASGEYNSPARTVTLSGLGVMLAEVWG